MIKLSQSAHEKLDSYCQINILTSVFLFVCPLIGDKLRHNIVKVAVEPRAAGEWFRSKLVVMTFIVKFWEYLPRLA